MFISAVTIFVPNFRRLIALLGAIAMCMAAAQAGAVSPALSIMQMFQGVTPFIEIVQLQGAKLPNFKSAEFTITPKPGTASKPVHVTYSMNYLLTHGSYRAGAVSLLLPVFGLYAGESNNVTMKVTYNDGSTETVQSAIQAAVYTSRVKAYQQVEAITQRAPGSALGFDFFYIKSQLEGPVIMDTDGLLRWVGAPQPPTSAVLWDGKEFLSGSTTSNEVSTTLVNGPHAALSNVRVGRPVVGFTHDLEFGKTGVLGVLNTTLDGVDHLMDLTVEFSTSGVALKLWDISQILTLYMQNHGDDPALFVRNGVDWWHQNTQIYDPSDDSLILSSRENFVMKIDYATGQIKWILGDPSKYWYSFPSLRAKALTILGEGLAPIGQHSVTIAPDGSLLLFNDGMGSKNVPPGKPPGTTRNYSAVSDYVIDPVARTATNVWNYIHQPIYDSTICSSVQQLSDKSMLIDYSYAANGTQAHLVGLDANQSVVFDYQMTAGGGCGTAWNAQPLNLDTMVLQ